MKTLETLLCLFVKTPNFDEGKEEVKAAFKYPECEFCINHVMDPFACDDCEDGDNFEPDDVDRVENLTYHEFLEEHFNKEVA